MRQGWQIAVLCTVACGSSDPVLSVSVDTVSGIPIITSRTHEGDPQVSWHLDTAGALVIGTVDGPEEARFGRLAAVTRGADGRIFVPDGQALTIRVFSSDGGYLGPIGRAGEGPGEFRSLDGAVVQ